jgi:hypothetical protein
MLGIYKSLTDTSMWKFRLRPRTIPFLGIFLSNFRYCVFVVNSKQFFILSHVLRLANLFALRTGFNSNGIEDICNW